MQVGPYERRVLHDKELPEAARLHRHVAREEPGPMCAGCAAYAKQIAATMGFPLAMSRIAEVLP